MLKKSLEKTMKKQQIYRHGEILFLKIKELPAGLKIETSKEFLKGSHGNPHMFDNGDLYFKKENEFVFGYFTAKNTELKHIEHGNGNGELKVAKLPDGNYQLRRQVEFINQEMKPVID